MGRGPTPPPPSYYLLMTFLVKFLWSDPGFIKPKNEFIPVVAKNRDEAIAIFNKFLGIPFHYPILDISLYEYD